MHVATTNSKNAARLIALLVVFNRRLSTSPAAENETIDIRQNDECDFPVQFRFVGRYASPITRSEQTLDLIDAEMACL